MFLHFIVATLFIGAGIWLYSAIALGDAVAFPIVAMVILFILWFVLYFSGRLGREAGKEEMKALQGFLFNTLKKHEIGIL